MIKTILAIDDSETMRDMVKQTLDMGNYNIIMAIDGKDGLKKFMHNEVNLIITDINMPVMDGIQLIKEIRKVNQDVPILTLTTESEDDMKKKGSDAGANGWIVKPLHPAQLLDIIEQILL